MGQRRLSDLPDLSYINVVQLKAKPGGKMRSKFTRIGILTLATAVWMIFLPGPRSTFAQQLAATPPMGWNSWNHFACKVNDAVVRAEADAMASDGMKEAGYRYINVDDCWQGQRDAQGVIHPNERFPDMKALADYIHSKGLKFGIYSSPGPKTCAGYEGSFGHEEQDAETYAKWGVDYLKYDWCTAKGDEQAAYTKMHEALLKTGRPIVFSLCQYGEQRVWAWGASVGGNLWRTTDDISDDYDRMSVIGFDQNGLERFAGPGHWNDPDMLEIGNGKMTDDEYRTHMSLWCLLAAPLMAGNDLAHMAPGTLAILTNREVVAVDQDPAGVQGHRVTQEGPLEVWMKPMADGSKVVGLFNRATSSAPITVQFDEIGVGENANVRDLWAHQDLGKFEKSYTVDVPRHGVVLIRVKE
jgi:alpha-galactosidase